MASAMPEPFVPNPGSTEAMEAGCTCAVLDNNRGRFPPWPPSPELPRGAWYITAGCPLHGLEGE